MFTQSSSSPCTCGEEKIEEENMKSDGSKPSRRKIGLWKEK